MTDAALAEHNTELGFVAISTDQGYSYRIGLATNLREKRRGAKPARIVAEYCPLCGVRYQPVEARNALAAAAPGTGGVD